MEAKEASETTQNSKNEVSTSTPTQDSSQAGIKANNKVDRDAGNGTISSALPSAPTADTQPVDMQVTGTEKETTVGPPDEKSQDDNKIPKKTLHDSTDKAPAAAKMPAASAGNDQVTVDNTQQSLHESTGSTNPPSDNAVAVKPPSSTGTVSNIVVTKPMDTTIASKPTAQSSDAPQQVPSPLKTAVETPRPQPAMKPSFPPLSAPPALKTTLDSKTPSQPAAMKAPVAATQTVPTAAFTATPAPATQQMVTRGFGPSPDETLARLRLPLTETYGPFIYATDTSLSDARQRLRTALEQTRSLREAFTERVYEKYRIILRPAPKSIDDIVNPIVADPVTAHRKLYERMQEISEEKAIEKKEAQKVTSAKTPVGPDGVPLANAVSSAAETAEQIQFLSAGLSLVVLPEDEVDASEIDLSQYQYRGPVNPETGQRVVGLSVATATAAESLLDRVRRGGAMRIERQRRRQLQLLSGETPETDTSYASSLHFMSVGDSARRSQKKAKGSRGNKTSAPYPSAGKTSRSRISTALSGSNLLTLNPAAEELKTDGKRSAATAALISRGVGDTRTTQQRWRHPHPESPGGRRALGIGTGSGQKLTDYVARSLPSLPLLNTKRTPVKTVDDPRPGTERARTAVRTVLEQFVDTEELSTAAKSASHDAGSSGEPMQISEKDATTAEAESTTKASAESEKPRSVNPPPDKICRKRGATEIGLRRSLQYAAEQGMKRSVVRTANPKPNDEQQSATSSRTIEGQQATPLNSQLPATESVGEPPLPPALAFSVVHALGLVRESAREKKNSSRTLSSLVDFTTFEDKATAGNGEGTQTISRMQALSRKILGQKRSFSHAFLANTTMNDSNGGSSVKEAVARVGTDENSSSQESAKKKARKEAEDNGQEGEMQEETTSDGCPVLSIRGGGGGDVADAPDNRVYQQEEVSNRGRRSTSPRKSKPTDSAPTRPRSGSEPSSHEAMLAELTQPPLNLMNSRRPASASDALYSGFSPSRPSTSPGLSSDRGMGLRRQHLNMHGSPSRAAQLAHGAFPMNRFPSPPRHLPGDMPDYYGVSHGLPSGYGGDWPSMGTSTGSAGYLPPPHASMPPLGLAGHRAAMVEMSVRDRARALLASEQQHNSAVAAHAAAAQRHANMANLSQTTTTALMNASSGHVGHDFFGPPAGARGRYPHLSRAQSAPVDPSMFHGGMEPAVGDRSSMNKKRKSSSNTSRRQKEGAERIHYEEEKTARRHNSLSHPEGPSEPEAPRGKKKRANGELDAARLDLKDAGGQTSVSTTAKKDASASFAARKPHPDPPVEQDFMPPPTKLKTNNSAGNVSTDESSSPLLTTTGMQFVLPASPPEMSDDIRDLILGGSFYSALENDGAEGIGESALVEYLLAVGAAVPIPKATISHPLKERLSTPAFKSQTKDAAPPIPKEVGERMRGRFLSQYESTDACLYLSLICRL
jgi:hypothetical protein